tara:strand:+ start:3094 stop:3648 length:555 start_codon:yes stop_codon:yes gene_type:complete
MNIAEKLLAIQTELKAPKNQTNKFGNYKYRSAEDILEALKPYLSKYKVIVKISNKTTSVCDMPYVKSTAKIINAEDPNSFIESTDDAFIELNAKGMQMPQKSGAASSYAKKYALGNLFLLDDTKDADATNDHKTINTSSKPLLNKKDAAYDRVVSYVKTGGDVNEVLKKYSVSSPLKKELESLV